ncbi:hypothetical protein DL96DRAFT_1575467 [Flagelloscypha sp. PMI_526]|nr:hypothetical protein DL96DRAFT_1575467 [Flagelloscypha sp. PMI_526]
MRRAAFFASRLRKGDAMWRAGEEGEKDPKALKTLETQHYLELVDAKHRYGSNLKVQWPFI